ncbi:MAG: DHH family phosphoesterase [Aerococcus sp.]|nr:DHH family phosphoesterase [Aerococcus sp.]
MRKQKKPFYAGTSSFGHQDVMLPIVMIVLLLLLFNVFAFYNNRTVGWVTLGVSITILAIGYFMLRHVSQNQQADFSDLVHDIDTVENEILLAMPLGIIIFHDDGSMRWMNPYMQRYFGRNDISLDDDEVQQQLQEYYEALVSSDEKIIGNQRIASNETYFDIGLIEQQHAMYFLDVTEYGQNIAEARGNRFVIGYILIDNYDEIVSRYSDRRKSNVDNYVMKQLSAWVSKHNGYLKRVDDDRFLVLTTLEDLQAMEDEKFTIIDSVREATSKANFPLTLSMGFSYQIDFKDTNLADISSRAQSNLDLAQSRGGDQVVIKSQNEKARYYGGKSNPMEKRTHVRARQISTTLSKMIEDNDDIYVMGHDYPDMDAIGACLGIRRFAEMHGKNCKIVIQQEHLNEDIEKLIVELQKDEAISSSIISPKEAEAEIDPNALLFLVDCHRQSITVAPELVDRVNGVVVIDHHRKSEDVPSNILLEYIEPYASSSCELITEFFEYQEDKVESINRIEATTMLAGIVVDSRSFSLRTGSRTFDAASYLKSCGADSIMIQEFLKEDLADYIERSHLIENVQFVGENVGIAAGEDDVTYPIVLAAQAADELLSMNGIASSYVVYLREDGRVGISARSMGNVNVQTVMEQLGGGGHLSNAATQIEDASVSEAVTMLRNVLMNEEATE